MSTHFKDILRETKSVRLTEAEKMHGRSQLRAFMEQHPVTTLRLPAHRSLWSWKMAGSFAVAAGFAVLLFVSKGSLPGDNLYSVKIGVTEPLQLALTFSDQKRVDLETGFAVERLAEADRLAASNKLDPALQTKLQASFDEHVSRASDRIEQLAEKKKADDALTLGDELERVVRDHAGAASPVGIAASTVAPMALSVPTPEQSSTPEGFVARKAAPLRGAEETRADERGVGAHLSVEKALERIEKAKEKAREKSAKHDK